VALAVSKVEGQRTASSSRRWTWRQRRGAWRDRCLVVLLDEFLVELEGFLTMLISENADGHAWARDLGQLDGTAETFVTLGIVILEADLQLHGLEEVALLGLLTVLKEFFHILPVELVCV
jgi:hypothetical protein